MHEKNAATTEGIIRTKEIIQVRVEVGDVTLGGDEREHVPVRVRAVFEVPCVSAYLDVLGDNTSYTTNTANDVHYSFHQLRSKCQTYPPRSESHIMLH